MVQFVGTLQTRDAHIASIFIHEREPISDLGGFSHLFVCSELLYVCMSLVFMRGRLVVAYALSACICVVVLVVSRRTGARFMMSHPVRIII